MKVKKKSIAWVSSLLITVGVVLFLYFYQYYIHDTLIHLRFLRISVFVLGVLVINYLLINYILSLYLKNQLTSIVQKFPNYQTKENFVIDEISKEINNLQTRNLNEIDMLKKMEFYRKEFLGNLSHELKTPLFSIQGYVETLINGGVDDLNIRDKYLERINLSVERMQNLVEDLDMISHLEKGEIGLVKSKFRLNDLVEEVFDFLDLEAKNNKAHLILVENKLSIYVNADKQKIFQVFVNLISNAIHYSKRDEAQIKVILSQEGQMVCIKVTDNGMGIKEDVLPRIFERFYRVDSSRSRKDGGSGLGLPIVKHILEAHKQIITVESVYLEGTIFSFKLPLV